MAGSFRSMLIDWLSDQPESRTFVVRSSGTAEDGSKFSFAGVRTDNNLGFELELGFE